MEFFKSWTNSNNQKINFSNSYVTSSGLSLKKDDKTLRHINSSDSLSKTSDCSDFILDSDHCDSDHCDSDHCDSDHCDSDHCDSDVDHIDQEHNQEHDQDQYDQHTQTEHNTKEYYSQYVPKTTPCTLKKTGSTGDLRVYTKTDLKNKINNLEHRILMIEKRLERNMAVPVYSKKIIKSADYGIPGIIKFAMISLFLAHLGKYVN